MPGHGLISLVAYGSQDLYLTGNPQITFWKVVYKRYTNFAMESVPQPLTGNVDFGQRFSAVISRNVGDLAHKSLLQLTIPVLTSAQTALGTVRWVDKLGHAIIDWYELVIGGTTIDHQYGEWLEIYSQLTLPPSKLPAYNRMIGHTTTLLSSATTSSAILYIPLQFFFCQTPGLALPLVSLQYHDVRINFQLKPLEELIIQTNPIDVFQGSIVDATLYVDYIYLDVQERQQFAARRHEYLITQVQYNGAEPVIQTTTTNPASNSKMTPPGQQYFLEFQSSVQVPRLGDTESGIREHIKQSNLQLHGSAAGPVDDGHVRLTCRTEQFGCKGTAGIQHIGAERAHKVRRQTWRRFQPRPDVVSFPKLSRFPRHLRVFVRSGCHGRSAQRI